MTLRLQCDSSFKKTAENDLPEHRVKRDSDTKIDTETCSLFYYY